MVSLEILLTSLLIILLNKELTIVNLLNDEEIFQEVFDLVFHKNYDMIFLIDETGTILETNMSACRYFNLTLPKLENSSLSKYIKETKQFENFMKKTIEYRSQNANFTFLINQQTEIIFQISSFLIQKKDTETSFILLLCRDIQALVDSNIQEQLFFEIFQHDLLNNFHAEIGYLDFFQRLYESDNLDKITGNQMLTKIKEIIVRNIFLIQNTNLNILLQKERKLGKQKIKDVIAHTTRYIENFYKNRISIAINRMDDFIILGDEYLYKIFVNLIVKMLDYTEDKIEVEITVSPPIYESSKVILHFENVRLSFEEKDELLDSRNLDKTKLDIVTIRTLLNAYTAHMKIEDVKRTGRVVG
ncbi:MAG: PAS domain-containing protein, partial [Candidatus Heimdallarchaeaceae archaeon]